MTDPRHIVHAMDLGYALGRGGKPEPSPAEARRLRDARTLASLARELGGDGTEAGALLADALGSIFRRFSIDGKPDPVTEMAEGLSLYLRADIGDYETEREAFKAIENAAERGWCLAMEAEEADAAERADGGDP